MHSRIDSARWHRKGHWGVITLVPLLLLSGTPGCDHYDSLEQIRADRTLTVVTRNGPTTYYRGSEGPTGFEYTLAQRFADHLGVKLVIREAHSLQDLFQQLGSRRAQLATASLAATEDRRDRYQFAPPYFEASQLLVYRAGTSRPRRIEDILDADLQVPANGGQAELLRQLARSHPNLRWRETPGWSSLDLLDQVERGTLRFTVVDSNAFRLYRAYFPGVKRGFDLAPPAPVAWALTGGPGHARLQEELSSFFERLRQNGDLERLKERFYGHTSHAGPGDSRTFARRFRQRLPHYEPLIRSIAEAEGLDWRLLAAISYRESHWNPDAVSRTGVRGMMMLTKTTAREMGIADRTDPTQSLVGGARYFMKIWRRIPPDIAEPDKTWFALAAYNLGMGHLNDARILTERQGADPHRWPEVMERLPLLEQKAHYSTLRNGFARGSEAVRYVQHIRHYYHLMEWLTADQPPATQLARNDDPAEKQDDVSAL